LDLNVSHTTRRKNGTRQVTLALFGDTKVIGVVHSAARPRLVPPSQKSPISDSQQIEIDVIASEIRNVLKVCG
jgi:hypothetical protein